jgi:hypothetical protein
MTTTTTTKRGGTRRRWTDNDDDNDNDNNNDNDDDDNAEGAIVRTGPLSGNDTADLAIGILRADQGSYMLRLPLGLALAFDCGQ